MFRIEERQDIIEHSTGLTVKDMRIEKDTVVINFNDNSSLVIMAFDYKLSASISAD